MMAGAHDGMAAVKAAVESSTGDESQMRRPLTPSQASAVGCSQQVEREEAEVAA